MSESEHFVRACVRDVFTIVIVSCSSCYCFLGGSGLHWGRSWGVGQELLHGQSSSRVNIYPGMVCLFDFGYFDLFCTAGLPPFSVSASLIEESTIGPVYEVLRRENVIVGVQCRTEPDSTGVMPLPQPDGQVAQLTQIQAL